MNKSNFTPTYEYQHVKINLHLLNFVRVKVQVYIELQNSLRKYPMKHFRVPDTFICYSARGPLVQGGQIIREMGV